MSTSIISSDVKIILKQAARKKTKSVRINGKDVSVPVPFPSPADWRDQWIYFLLVDRFNNPESSPRFSPYDGAHGVFQGGNFNGIREQLAYLHQLGVGAIWLSPVFKNCQYNPFTYHGYGIQDFLQIDPRFASNPTAAAEQPDLVEKELRDLVDEAHAYGIYIILDIVLNHSGDIFEYILDNSSRVSEANWRDRPYTINWRDENGKGREDWTDAPPNPHSNAAVWPTELRRNEYFRRKGRGGEAGGDFASLKEMVTGFWEVTGDKGFQYPVRNILILAFQYAIARYDVDGFRIDTLKYIEPEFAQVFGNSIREYALSIGKKNFFTFGEVYDNEEQIARFIGRQAAAVDDVIGVDAALDFPLFFKIPSVIKGFSAPTDIVQMFEHRKQVERSLISSHGDASRFFITFLDNHDQRQRFYFRPSEDPDRYRDQLTLGIGCLFALQGIPCLYYGTEQGLHGAGNQDHNVREALWGKNNPFDREQVIYRTVEELSKVRNTHPALRYGRQYFRPISGDGLHFSVSPYSPGILSWSRILNDEEILVVANTNIARDWSGEILVDFVLNPAGSSYGILFSNIQFSSDQKSISPGTVIDKSFGDIEINEINGTLTYGPARTLPVTLKRMEIQILQKI